MCKVSETIHLRQDGASETSIPIDRASAGAAADIRAARREFYFRPPPWVAQRIAAQLVDQRDVPILWLLFNICVTTIPAAIALFSLNTSHWLGAAYLACNYTAFLQRFLLGLHCLEHRGLFKTQGLNHLPSLVVAPLFGLPSGLYRLHHCIMHHVEGNAAPHDLSSTESYQRDNPVHFIWYWLRHAVGIWVELPLYAMRRGRCNLAIQSLAAEVAYTAAVCFLWQFNSTATLWVFLLPYAISSFALMFGNWSQHVFIDAAHPDDCYRMAYNCIHTPDNQKTFNDGYHIQHHLNSRLHWTELPQRFQETIGQHAQHKALIFEGVGWFDVGVAVFCRQDSMLLKWFVRHGDFQAMTDADIVALLRQRLRPVRRQRKLSA